MNIIFEYSLKKVNLFQATTKSEVGSRKMEDRRWKAEDVGQN